MCNKLKRIWACIMAMMFIFPATLALAATQGSDYEVIIDSSSNVAGSYDTLEDAVSAAISAGEACTIILNAADTDMSDGLTTPYVTIPAGCEITLKSDAGGPHTITQQETINTTGNGARHFIVEGTLTLENIILSGTTLSSQTNTNNGGIYVDGGALILNTGAVIKNCAAYGYNTTSGAILADNGATVTMNGDASVAYNFGHYQNKDYGTGVTVANSSSLVMNDASSVHDNVCTVGPFGTSGVGIFTGSSFEMNDNASIYENIHSGNGGGGGVQVHGNGTSFIMNNGTIYGNQAAYAGGIEIQSGASVEMNGGKIYENVATFAGGSVGSGGGVYVGINSSFVMNDGAVYDNTAVNSGGGIFMNGGTFEMYDGSIRGNKAGGSGSLSNYGNGGGIANNSSPCEMKIYGGTIEYNTATGHGGGIYCSNGAVTLCGNANDPISIAHNEARNGGGVLASVATLNAENCEIIDNTATYGGGGIYFAGYTYGGGSTQGSELLLKNMLISDNKAEYAGGIMFDQQGAGSDIDYRIEGSKISGNIADGHGGGIYVLHDYRLGGTATTTYTITDTAIVSNAATDGDGGGIYYFHGSGPAEYILTGTAIQNNEASAGNGGGIFVNNKVDVDIQGGSISYNIVSKNGGGIYVDGYLDTGTDTSYPGVVTVDGTQITGNEADMSGGGVYVADYGEFYVLGDTNSKATNTVIYGNLADKDLTDSSQNAGDDVYATGENTKVILINAEDMLIPDSFGANLAWFTDYQDAGLNRTRYRDGGRTVYPGTWAGSTYTGALSLALNALDTVSSGGGGGGGSVTTYTMTYHANGGKGSEHKVSGISANAKHTVLTASAAGISREGYDFKGWNTKTDGSGTAYAAGSSLTVKQSVTLYAQWEKTEEKGALETGNHITYIKGYTDGTVRPDNAITRAEASAIFYRLLKNPTTVSGGSFSDVKGGAWYSDAVNCLASMGIVTGYSDGSFRPDAQITRAEFATIASRFDALDSGAPLSFTDVSADYWAYDYIASAYAKGWISGYSDSTFRPDNSITRAEVVKIVNTMLGRKIDSDALAQVTNPYQDLSKNHWAYADIIEASVIHEYTRDDNGGEIWQTW